MNTRAVVIGKAVIYLGPVTGNMTVPILRIKGDPAQYVRDLLAAGISRDEVRQRLEIMAYNEGLRCPFVANKKMGETTFWRNAFGYFANLTKGKNARVA